MRRAHAARTDHRTPAAENDIDALLFPRRHRCERARKALVRRDADDAKLAGRNVAVDVSRRGRDEIDVTAEQRRNRFSRAFESHRFQVSRFAADGFHQQTRADMVVAAEGRSKTDAK